MKSQLLNPFSEAALWKMTVWRQVPVGAELIMNIKQLIPSSESAPWKMTVCRQVPEGAELIMKNQQPTSFSDPALGN